MGKVFRMLDHQTLLNARLVCGFWRHGLDILTDKGAVNIRGQSFISSEQAQLLLAKADTNKNPFPSRTVRMSMTLNEGRKTSDPSSSTSMVETDAVRTYGTHIKFLNIKLITCSTKRKAMLNVVKNIVIMLCHLPNLQGLSVYISFVFDNARCYSSNPEAVSPRFDRAELDSSFLIPEFKKLKAFRLVAWNSSSEETEWLYYKILRQSPNLEFFDPDFYMGYNKFYTIFSEPKQWPFQLKCLKLALSGRVVPEVFQLLREAKFPLTSVYLDIFEFSCVKQPCYKVIQSLLKSCESSLRTIAVSFYLTSKSIPSSSSRSSAAADILGSSSSFIRKVVTTHQDAAYACMSYAWLKSSNLLSSGGAGGSSNAHNSCKLENLKLRGFKGSLNFLKDFKQLRRLILLDYNPQDQNLFKSESDFYRNIPQLKELYTPRFGSLDVKSIKSKMMDEQYLPIYW